MDQLREFISTNPILAASLSSLWGAVVIDLWAFQRAKEPGAWVKGFQWQIALWRYAQALVGGFLGNLVLAGGAGVIALMWWFG